MVLPRYYFGMVDKSQRKSFGKVIPEERVYQSVDDALVSTAPTLGQRNNNPLNIRYTLSSVWLGQLGENRGFVVFMSMSYGVRAAYKLLKRYIRQGYNTIPEIVNRWAPSVENPTDSYISFVSKKTGIPLEYEFAESDVNSILKLLMAMSYFESGYIVTSLDLMRIDE